MALGETCDPSTAGQHPSRRIFEFIPVSIELLDVYGDEADANEQEEKWW